ncbi:hypothetical protein MIMGU_mgv1a010445mg [Erythranthe guttata]|uniref:AB hydrolase-1 domain-containing protein n=1 Tax=Erythranthe guttata TaxID=4155 RepID=A0A022QJL3_ERYGU|nr:hypothetical protein MIMGU_mgv1a010445mg [Erythranthe guttata]
MVFKKVVSLMMGCLGLAKQPTQPAHLLSETTGESLSINEVQRCCNSQRIKLSDGRLLAYAERGVPKSNSIYRVIVVHGFASSKDMNFMASQDLLDELKIYLVLFDRAGYGDSDPNPKRSLKTEASDIEQLADKLQLGSWGVTSDDYRKGLSKWAVMVARCAPGLLHLWLTQKLFPSSTVLDRNPSFFSAKDLEVLKNTPGYQLLNQNKIRDRTVFNSLRRDFIVAFGKWDFDPLDLQDPYPKQESMVHIWQGYEDKVVPFQLQRYVSEKLPWIRYHEVPDGGHLLVYDTAVCEAILRSLLLGEDSPLYNVHA